MRGVHRPERMFGIVFGASTLVCVLAVASINYVVDPYAVFDSPAVAGLNALKPRPDVMLADVKLIVGARYQPTALILGNSRADVGFDPSHPVFAAHRLHAYNAAVPGSGLDYSVGAFRRFTAMADVRSAVVGIDFLDFLYRPDDDGSAAPAVDSTPTRTRLLALFSITALLDSIRTVVIQREPNPALVRSDGFNPMLDYRQIATTEGYSALFRQRAQEVARNLVRRPHNLDVGGRRMSPAFGPLRSLLALAGETRTEVKLVIYPYHLLLLLQYDEAGLWPLFEQWKKDVAAIADEARKNGVQVSLWDFSCPTALTAEAIPDDGDLTSSVNGYWEAGHFKKELGDLVLSRIFGPPDVRAADGDFGFELTPANVDARNTFCRSALLKSRDRFPAFSLQAAALWQSAKLRK
jgi:hypothetical protein